MLLCHQQINPNRILAITTICLVVCSLNNTFIAQSPCFKLGKFCKDTVFENGVSIQYEAKANMVAVYICSQDKKRLIDTLTCDEDPSSLPQFRAISDNYIILTSSCGSPCWVDRIVPFNPSKDVRLINYVYSFDPESNSIAYLDEEGMILENLSSEQISLTPIKANKCSSPFVGDCIESVAIRKGKLRINYFDIK